MNFLKFYFILKSTQTNPFLGKGKAPKIEIKLNGVDYFLHIHIIENLFYATQDKRRCQAPAP